MELQTGTFNIFIMETRMYTYQDLKRNMTDRN